MPRRPAKGARMVFLAMIARMLSDLGYGLLELCVGVVEFGL